MEDILSKTIDHSIPLDVLSDLLSYVLPTFYVFRIFWYVPGVHKQCELREQLLNDFANISSLGSHFVRFRDAIRVCCGFLILVC